MNRREALMSLMALPAVTRISTTSLKPDDVIVLEYDGVLSVETAERLKTHIKQVWPEQKCIVLDSGMKLKVVSR